MLFRSTEVRLEVDDGFYDVDVEDVTLVWSVDAIDGGPNITCSYVESEASIRSRTRSAGNESSFNVSGGSLEWFARCDVNETRTFCLSAKAENGVGLTSQVERTCFMIVAEVPLWPSEPPTLTRVVTANATMNGTIQPRQLLSSWVWPSCDAPLPSSCVSVSYALCTEDGCSSPTAIAASQANLSISLQHPQLLDYNGRVWLEYSATNLSTCRPSQREPAGSLWGMERRPSLRPLVSSSARLQRYRLCPVPLRPLLTSRIP